MITAACIGQSNGDGRDNRGHFNISGLVTAWNNPANTFGISDVSSGMGSGWVAPGKNAAPFFVNNSAGGLRSLGNNHAGVHACSYLARMTGQPVRMVNACRGSTPIKHWMEADGTPGPQYGRLKNILAAASVMSLAVVFLQFGEGDNGEAALFAARLGHLLSAMEADGFITAATPIVLGQPRPQYADYIAAIADIEANSGRVRVAATQSYGSDDGDHFNGDALGYIGYEYVRALQRMGSVPFGLPAHVTPARRIYARGFFQTIVPPGGSPTDIPLIGDHGELTMMRPDGYLVIPIAGRWRFSSMGYINRAKPRWYLRDGSDAVLATLGMELIDDVNQNSTTLAGSAEVILCQGTRVKLSVYHSGSSVATIDAGSAWCNISLSAEYIGPL